MYGDSRRRILVANSDGLLAGDDQVKTRFAVSCVALGDTGMQTGRESIGRTVGFELFDSYAIEDLARVAAERALLKLAARPAPSGTVPVVIKAGSGGILFHEACGHGLEADHIAKDTSVFAGRVGNQVASPLVTLVDDGTDGPRVGRLRHRRRGLPDPQQRADSEDGSSPTTCGTGSGPARRAVRAVATAGGRPTSTCRWSA